MVLIGGCGGGNTDAKPQQSPMDPVMLEISQQSKETGEIYTIGMS